MRKLLKIITLIKMRLWITAVFFLLSSINFVSVKWGNTLNINKINKNTLCPPEPYLKPTVVVKLTMNNHQPGNISSRHEKKRIMRDWEATNRNYPLVQKNGPRVVKTSGSRIF